jgi:hypothetical protein
VRNPVDPVPAVNEPTFPRPRELAMSAAWNARLTRALMTTGGDEVHIVHHGTWSHGFGPDFTNAMVEIGGRLRTGDIEIHTRSSDWVAHGHHTDERYNDVIMHIVTVDDLPETRRQDGAIVPVAILTISDDVLFAIDRRLPDAWSELGGTVCADELAQREPARIRRALHRLGDDRLAARLPAIESAIAEGDGNAVLLRMIFDALGYSENRGPMRQLADVLIRHGLHDHPRLEPAREPSHWLIGMLLGMGGFLPLAPADAHAGGILPEDQYRLERAWAASGAALADDMVPASAWQVARVRPANHPVSRIMQAATLLGRYGGRPLDPMIEAIRAGESIVEWVRETTTRPGHPGLGTGRATAMAASVLLPFSLAFAAYESDAVLEDAARQAWVGLRHAEWTRPAKRARTQVTGGPGIRGLGERGHQGLLHLDRELCAPRRCFECPIAAEVVRDRVKNRI